jgi:FMNH2-dependent dimethyl sulfone monooxygenase
MLGCFDWGRGFCWSSLPASLPAIAAAPLFAASWARHRRHDLVQYNDGFRSNLIGTPRQIAERILALKDAGASLILLGFLHFHEEVEHFGKHVIPLVRELEAERRHAAIAAE